MTKIDELLTNDAVLAEIGRRLEHARLQRNLTQAELADAAGIGEATLRRLEGGRSVQATTLVKLFRAIDLLPALDALLPQSGDSPIAQLERQQHQPTMRRRATSRARRVSPPAAPAPWRWGDEREDSV